ncbi:putative phosphatidylinositol 4-phosphate 5-kinase MSS4 [Candida viswanathii]|uniref:1-phosphatidylinositol-4-phosphate 5-kinase n=1 Tax=Candida viswanathii TaxID=5486 RepID=A0A367XRM0_9ASCO|nr:putative phosphatidylinositol 4-phosphate 5-kinase MSS4 [Candida viswanathii]
MIQVSSITEPPTKFETTRSHLSDSSKNHQQPQPQETRPPSPSRSSSSISSSSSQMLSSMSHSQQGIHDTLSSTVSSTPSSHTSHDDSTLKLPLLTSENLQQQDEIVEETNNHHSPSTPTSFKGTRSETNSNYTHETTPSSIEHNESKSLIPPPESSDQFQFQYQTKRDNVRNSLEVDPLHNMSTRNHSTDDSTIKSKPASVSSPPPPQPSISPAQHTAQKPISPPPIIPTPIPEKTTLATSLVTPKNVRRHTSPVPVLANSRSSGQASSNKIHRLASRTESVIALSRHSITIERPLNRNTYSGTGPPQQLPVTTSFEIQRMRDTIVQKRQFKKRLTEEERVLVGNKISEGHENFVMAYNMLTGIRVAVSRCSGVMRKLTDEDFKSTKKLSFNFDGSELTPSSKYDFKFKDYCPEVFRELRQIFGIDPADYLVSITGKYILSELGSPGKSGSFFYYSRDFRFIIKTIHHSEHKQLLRMLKDYHLHVKDNPNTLISQFYGLHRVKMPLFGGGSRKVHFVVMNNLFPPHRDIHLKYDLKGSTWGRSTTVPPGHENEMSKFTLKDLNWLEDKRKIQFGPEKRNIFFKQLEADVKLLKKVNVMDYSLLLGIHDVKKGNSDDLEKQLSVFEPKSFDKMALISTNPRDLDRLQDLPSDVFPGRSKYVFYGHDGGIRATTEDNVPTGEIYYLGIIDCLTNYSFRKRLETMWRSLSHQRSTILAVPAKEYGDRFLSFMKKGTTQKKKKRF